MLLTSSTWNAQKTILTCQTNHRKLLIRMNRTIRLIKIGLRTLTLRVHSTTNRRWLFYRLLIRFKLLTWSTGLIRLSLNVFSFLFLSHQRHQHLVSKLIDHPQLAILQLNNFTTTNTLSLTHPVQNELMLMVRKSQTLHTKGMLTRQLDQCIPLLTVLTLTVTALHNLTLHNVTIIITMILITRLTFFKSISQ